jgi:hypothetical protein
MIDGYEFHYLFELSPDNLHDVRAALGDHDISTSSSTPRSGREVTSIGGRH